MKTHVLLRISAVLMLLACPPEATMSVAGNETRTILIAPFEISPKRQYQHLSQSLANLLAFRFRQDKQTGKRFTVQTVPQHVSSPGSMIEARKADWFIRGRIYFKSNAFEVKLLLYKKKGTSPYITISCTKNSLAGIFDALDCCYRQILEKGLKIRARSTTPEQFGVDLVLCLDSSPDMKALLPDLTRNLYVLQRSLRASSPSGELRLALLHFSGNTIHSRTALAFSADRVASRLENIRKKLYSQQPESAGRERIFKDATVPDALFQTLRHYRWRKNALHTALFLSHRPPGKNLHHELRKLSAHNIHLLAANPGNFSPQTRSDWKTVCHLSGGRLVHPGFYGNYYIKGRHHGFLWIQDKVLFPGKKLHAALPYHGDLFSIAGRYLGQSTLFGHHTLRKVTQSLRRKFGHQGRIRDLYYTLGDATVSSLRELLKQTKGWDIKSPQIAGRVLLVSGNSRIWVKSNSSEQLEWFKNNIGRQVCSGVQVIAAPGHPDGLLFPPGSLRIVRNPDPIPRLICVSLRRIIERPAFYQKHGLFDPNIWYFQARVKNVKFFKR